MNLSIAGRLKTPPDAVPPVFHMLIVSPSSSKSSLGPDILPQMVHQWTNGTASQGTAWTTAIMQSASANATIPEDDYAWASRLVTLLGIWQVIVAIVGKCHTTPTLAVGMLTWALGIIMLLGGFFVHRYTTQYMGPLHLVSLRTIGIAQSISNFPPNQ